MANPHPAKQSREGASSEKIESTPALREKLRRYELIFRATNDVLYDLDLEDGSVEWNEALYTQYGYGRDEPAGALEWWTGHIHPDDALMLENRITDIFEGTTDHWEYEYRFRKADGSYNYVRDRGLLLRDEVGRPTRIVGSLLDVTAQKQLDIAKDEFVALVSHQLRTPLTVIRVYGEMLTSGMFGDLTDEQAKWVRNMTSSSTHLIDVVGAILNVSRIDLGRVKIHAKPHDMIELVEECIKDVRPLAEERKVQISFDSPAAMPLVNIDANVWTQITHNLLTNAIRYTKPGEGHVTVKLSAEDGDFVLSVEDNGIGVPEEAQEHIFERFYRAKNAQGVEVQGSGLGLYLIKVMTDAFGGKIHFKTREGRGTTFYVHVPERGMVST